MSSFDEEKQKRKPDLILTIRKMEMVDFVYPILNLSIA